jgi:N-acetylglucosaminyl-diphospho-decaprenol L-rhamnosyltransferase
MQEPELSTSRGIVRTSSSAPASSAETSGAPPGPAIAIPGVDIVIVNFNAGNLLGHAMESISAMDARSFNLERVVIVDNASTDGSTMGLNLLGLPVTVVANESNIGFAAACNQGASHCSASYLLFLNPDVQVSPAAIDASVRFMEDGSHRATGIVGVQLLDDQGRVRRNCSRFPEPHELLVRTIGLDRVWPRHFRPHLMTDWDHSYNRVVDQVPGAFYLVRRSLFRQLAGFDTRFFVYYEDLDFALRARQAGANTMYLADAFVCHSGQGSSRNVVAWRLTYSFDSKVRYAFKHFGRSWACTILVCTLVCEPIGRLAWAVGHGDWLGFKATLQAGVRFFAHVPRLLVEGFDA